MIDYLKIATAEKHYATAGFSRVEVPWTVTEQVSSITKPPGAKDFKLVHEDGKVLVASAEQSFLYQYTKGFLPKGKFQATTPCFRHEPFDAIHTKYFIKTELINTESVTSASLQEMVDVALKYFQLYLPKAEILELKRNESYDIVHDSVELGSYGIRSCSFLDWVYGTGVAEPRLSLAVRKARL